MTRLIGGAILTWLTGLSQQPDRGDHDEQTNNSYWIEYEGEGELSTMRNCQSPVSMSPSHMIISARDVSVSEKEYFPHLRAGKMIQVCPINLCSAVVKHVN